MSRFPAEELKYNLFSLDNAFMKSISLGLALIHTLRLNELFPKEL